MGCARPTGAKVGEKPAKEQTEEPFKKEFSIEIAKVGTKAPDFEAPAYYKGSFTSVKLSDYLVNGYYYVFTSVILHLSERPKYQRSL